MQIEREWNLLYLKKVPFPCPISSIVYARIKIEIIQVFIFTPKQKSYIFTPEQKSYIFTPKQKSFLKTFSDPVNSRILGLNFIYLSNLLGFWMNNF